MFAIALLLPTGIQSCIAPSQDDPLIGLFFGFPDLSTRSKVLKETTSSITLGVRVERPIESSDRLEIDDISDGLVFVALVVQLIETVLAMVLVN